MGRAEEHSLCEDSTQLGCSGGTGLYGYIVGRTGERVTDVSDSAVGQHRTFQYDSMNRLSATYWYDTGAQLFNYVYDRWGNRWQQNAPGGGPAPSYNFNMQNQVTMFSYDAAGEVLNDQLNTYTYDAEGNVLTMGATRYFYNALNERVRVDQGPGTDGQAYAFNQYGQPVSEWDTASTSWMLSKAYWGAQVVSFDDGGSTHFVHADWEGTERVQASYTGAVESMYNSLPFGDGYAASGEDIDAYHFAGQDQDTSANDHAQYREYSNLAGRWFSPDPYTGSYDPLNPQSMNRYAYVLSNPLGFTDPWGLDVCNDSEDYTNGQDITYDCVSADDGGDGGGDVGGSSGSSIPGYGQIGGGPAGGGGGGGGATGNAPNNGKTANQILQCASQVANQFSIAGVLGITGEGGGIGSTIGTAFLGNTFSGISDTITHVATGNFGAAYGDFALGGTAQGLPIGTVPAAKGIVGLTTDAAL